MMESIQKRLSLLLIPVLLCAALTGCGTKAPAADTPTALSVMRSCNTAPPLDPTDNSRAWYEIFVYSFYDSDGDGIGDFAGLTEKLDYINDGDPGTDTDLGCTGIWLMPIMPSPTYHKYDVTDYRAVDPAYGTMEDFDAFLSAAHQRGIRVILDLVLNHTSSGHPWFRAACDYLRALPGGQEPDLEACPYVGYYHFSRDPVGYQVSGTGWYYEAPFWSEMPDLDLGNPAVRAEIEDIAAFWLDKGVDGFRLDAAKEFVSGDTQANVEILSWFNGFVKSKNPDAYLVAEVWDSVNVYSQYYASGVDSFFDFAFADSSGVIAKAVKGASPAASYGRAVAQLQDILSAVDPDYTDAPFYTNHDMGRSAGYYSGDLAANKVKMAQALNLFMSGGAFLYYGEELGMKGAGRDENKRAPMYWSAQADAPDLCAGPPGMERFTMTYPAWDEQSQDGDSIFHFVVQAIRLRSAFPAISHGTAVFEESLSGGGLCVLRKSYEGQEVLLVFNLSETAQSVDLTGIAAGGGDPALAGVLVTTAEAPALTGGTLTLPMYSAAVLTAEPNV